MEKFEVNQPVSGGLFLTYKCTGACKHCMYACSPNWNADWIDPEGARKVLFLLSDKFKEYPSINPRKIDFNSGLHFTGGEPFLNFDLLLELTKMANDLEIPGTFVETNCFWCTDQEKCEEKLSALKEAGLNGILISINPFTLEHVPFNRTMNAFVGSRKIFGSNVLVYQKSFYNKIKRLEIEGTLALDELLERSDSNPLQGLELLPKGEAPYQLGELYKKYSAKTFFDKSCETELKRGWHMHIDNYFNYMPGYCGGISLGDARELESICEGIDLEDRPILRALVSRIEDLYRLGVNEFDYEENSDGYVSKCHLCLDIRKHIAERTDEFKTLKPKEFYSRIRT